jgi:hypothetical protein
LSKQVSKEKLIDTKEPSIEEKESDGPNFGGFGQDQSITETSSDGDLFKVNPNYI